MNKNFNKILLINLGGIGDIVMMTPIVKAIRDNLPEETHLALLTIRRSEEISRAIKGIDRIYTLPLHYRMPDISSIFIILKTLLAVRRQKYDIAINLRAVSSWRGCFKMLLLLAFIKPGFTVGRDVDGKGFFYDFAVKENKFSDENEVKITTRLLEPLGIENPDTHIFIEVKSETTDEVERYLSDRKITGSPLFGIHVGAFRPSRRWPIDKWRELLILLKEKYPSCFILSTGEKSDRHIAESLGNFSHLYITNGELSVLHSAALYKKLDILITNDTGAMHLAAAVGTKTVCIFGPGDHIRYAPSVSPSLYRIVRIEKLPDSCVRPCYRYKCSNPVCLTGIDASYVVAVIDEMIQAAVKRD